MSDNIFQNLLVAQGISKDLEKIEGAALSADAVGTVRGSRAAGAVTEDIAEGEIPR